MSATLSAGKENGYALGYNTDASGNLLWMTISSYGQMPNLNYYSPAKLYFTFYGDQYWFGNIAFFLIAVGSLILIGEILNTRLRRLIPVTLLLLICGIAIYPIGLQMSLSLNANHPTTGTHMGKEFALLDAYSGNFGNTNFGLFSCGVGTQQVPAFRGVFFPNVPLNYVSYLSYGFFAALAGVILIVIGYKTNPRKPHLG